MYLMSKLPVKEVLLISISELSLTCAKWADIRRMGLFQCFNWRLLTARVAWRGNPSISIPGCASWHGWVRFPPRAFFVAKSKRLCDMNSPINDLLAGLFGRRTVPKPPQKL